MRGSLITHGDLLGAVDDRHNELQATQAARS
jgi:hypothetical protein